jgi:hypothetical protein
VAPAGALAVVAALLPLLAVHQGTFVGVARPAEPFIAAYAGIAIVRLGTALATRAQRHGTPAAGRPALAAGLLLAGALVLPLGHDIRSRSASAVPPDRALGWIEQRSPPGAAVLAPPYYAALAGRPMRYDYADWTVLGMRAGAGRPREAGLAADLRDALRAGRLSVVIADFRLGYIAGAFEALDAAFAPAAGDGDLPGAPGRSVTLYVPAR